MFSRLVRWFDERWPYRALLRVGVEEDITGGDSYFYTLGSATAVVFLIQMITGMWQMFYYVPTVDHAYDSLNFMRTSVSFGWLIHNLHYWGANAMLVLIALHMIRVFLWAAYKKPRELTWLFGVGLFLLTMAMSFTGVPLPWDERGYWAAQVVTDASSTVPLVGDFIKRMMLGGASMAQLTLARFFMMHVAILPTILMLFIVLHIIALRQYGSVGPWVEEKRLKISPFWPDQVFKDVVVGVLIFLVVLGFAVFLNPQFTGPADPTDVTYIPKPEWNFLFFYQALKYFKGNLEPLGTLALPIIGVLIMVMIPFVDRGPQRNPFKRPLAMAFLALSTIVLLWLTLVGYYSTPSVAAPTVATAPLSASAGRGQALFISNNCAACHKVNGAGGTIGPDLSEEAKKNRTHDWLVTQIRDPKAHNPNTVMPATQLSDKDLDDLIDYLQSLGAKASASTASLGMIADPPADVTPGSKVFTTNNCAACHKVNGAGGTIGPDLSTEGTKNRTRDWLLVQIKEPKKHNSTTIMPGYKLKDTDSNALIDYLQSLGAPPPTPAPAPGNPPAPPSPSPSNATQGPAVYNANNCAACHKVNGVGGTIGPDLSNEGTTRTRDWLVQQINNPKTHNANSVMPAYSGLSEKDLNALIDYLLSLKVATPTPPPSTGTPHAANPPPPRVGVPVPPPAPPKPSQPPTAITPTTKPTTASKPVPTSITARGAAVFASNNCSACHKINGVGGTIGPDLSNEAAKRRSAAWLVAQIRNPKAHNASSTMPAYPNMSDADLNALVGYLKMPASKTAAPIAKPAIVSKPSPVAKPVSTSIAGRGAAVFTSNNCVACHKINGVGGAIGPDLSNEAGKGRSASWLTAQLRNPKAHKPSSLMPAYPKMSDADVNALVGYLKILGSKAATTSVAPPTPGAAPTTGTPPPTSTAGTPHPAERKTVPTVAVGQPKPPGEAAFTIGSASHGAVLYQANCQSCHGVEGKGGVPNPGSKAGIVPPLNPISRALFSTDPLTFAQKIDVVTQYGTIPAGTKPALLMPDYGTTNTLTQAEIANIEAYTMMLNGVDRAQLLHPGLDPKQFLLFAVIVLAAGALGLVVTYAYWKPRVYGA